MKSRREVLRSFCVGALASLFPWVAFGKDDKKAAGTPGGCVVEEKAFASLSFVHDASKAKARKDKAQNCESCGLYTANASRKGFGKCQVVQDIKNPNCLVPAAGWCSVWVAKPK